MKISKHLITFALFAVGCVHRVESYFYVSCKVFKISTHIVAVRDCSDFSGMIV